MTSLSTCSSNWISSCASLSSASPHSLSIFLQGDGEAGEGRQRSQLEPWGILLWGLRGQGQGWWASRGRGGAATSYPSRESSPSTAEPSIRHCASVVSGSFFCKGSTPAPSGCPCSWDVTLSPAPCGYGHPAPPAVTQLCSCTSSAQHLTYTGALFTCIQPLCPTHSCVCTHMRPAKGKEERAPQPTRYPPGEPGEPHRALVGIHALLALQTCCQLLVGAVGDLLHQLQTLLHLRTQRHPSPPCPSSSSPWCGQIPSLIKGILIAGASGWVQTPGCPPTPCCARQRVSGPGDRHGDNNAAAAKRGQELSLPRKALFAPNWQILNPRAENCLICLGLA